VAAPGTIGLTRMVRMTGKPSLPIPGPLFAPFVDLGRRSGLAAFSPDFRRLLRYGRAVDTTRLVDEVGFQPRHTAVAAVEQFVAAQTGRGLVTPLRRALA
jgi:UDP-glucose 4-epimerase